MPLPLNTQTLAVLCPRPPCLVCFSQHTACRTRACCSPTMASLVLYLSATALFAQSAVAFNCSKAPIYVDIHKRAVHDSSLFQYGSFIGVGTPAQNHSLWPSLSQNHTSFTSHDYCNKANSSIKNCDTSTGGFFNSKDSTTCVYLNSSHASVHSQ